MLGTAYGVVAARSTGGRCQGDRLAEIDRGGFDQLFLYGRVLARYRQSHGLCRRFAHHADIRTNSGPLSGALRSQSPRLFAELSMRSGGRSVVWDTMGK